MSYFGSVEINENDNLINLLRALINSAIIARSSVDSSTNIRVVETNMSGINRPTINIATGGAPVTNSGVALTVVPIGLDFRWELAQRANLDFAGFRDKFSFS